MARHKIKVNVRPQKTIIELQSQFISFKLAQGLAPRTIQDYRTTFTDFNKMDNTDLTLAVTSYFSRLATLSPVTYNTRYKLLNCFFNWTTSHDYLDSNPILSMGLKKRKEDNKVRHHETEDIKALLKVINLNEYTGFRDYCLILLTLDTGIRPSEAFGVYINDFDLPHCKLTIPASVAKTRVSRDLPLSAQVVQVIEKLISVKPADFPNLLFISLDGNPLNKDSWGKRVKAYSLKAKISPVTPYDLRHTFAISFLRNGGNVFALQRILGHTDLEMTKRYLQLADSDIREQHSSASPINQLMKRSTRVNKLFR